MVLRKSQPQGHAQKAPIPCLESLPKPADGCQQALMVRAISSVGGGRGLVHLRTVGGSRSGEQESRQKGCPVSCVLLGAPVVVVMGGRAQRESRTCDHRASMRRR